MTKILECRCKHEYQDQAYGPSKRVHNMCPVKDQRSPVRTWRCTVCEATREAKI